MTAIPLRTLLLLLVTVVVSGASFVRAEETPRWIGPPRDVARAVTLARAYELPPVRSARLSGVADFCAASFLVNGDEVASRRPYESPIDVDITGNLRKGSNRFRILVEPVDGPTAVFVRLDLEFADGTRRTFVTGDDWQLVDGNDIGPVKTFGPVARFPYGDREADVSIRPWDDYTQWKRAQGDAQATGAATFELPDGFEIDLVHEAATNEDGVDEGSWVAMTFDPQGRVVVAREKQGLLRLTLPKSADDGVKTEEIDDTLRECRGLAFSGGDLYAMANVDHALHRLRDTNGDGRFDEITKLTTFEGDNGHGRNQLTIGPDGAVHGIFGDSVFELETAQSAPPPLADPTAVEKTRSGFLARFDEDRRSWRVLVRGLRNPYGVAFNEHGDAFAYDADAEYDMGSPWYRPTRVLHLLPGADYGWRRVTKHWPAYDPDRPDIPRPMLDIGKGSPTAVAFGYGSKFPSTYRDALFALDWAYGRIFAVHLSPRGSSYAARAEVFLRGRPANVTDLAIGPDGAMYFVTGGRGTQSALYRVRYVGDPKKATKPTEQQRDRDRHAKESRERRRKLESEFGRIADLDRIWPHLSDADPWIRHAARVAVEWQKLNAWADDALEEEQPTAAAEGLLALARAGDNEYRDRLLARIERLKWAAWPERERLTLLFVLDRLLGDEPSVALAKRVVALVDPTYPGESAAWNREASLVLGQLDAPRFVDRTLPLLLAAESQEERLHYLAVLSRVDEGWSPESRRTYFEQLKRFDEFVGGEGMPTFRLLVRKAALESVPAAERDAFVKRLEADVVPGTDEFRTKFVREWSLDDLAADLGKVESGRDFERGRRAFAAARCIACHRVEGRGGVLGPDLATVSRRFAPRDVLVSILDPSKVVSEKYRQTTFVLDDGRVVTGRPLPGDYRAPELSVATDPLDATKVVMFPKSAIEEHRESTLSPMPKGLLNVLEKEDVLDLLAYLQAAGDPNHPLFRP